MEDTNVRVIDGLMVAGTILVIGIIGFIAMSGLSVGEESVDKPLFFFRTGKVIFIDDNINFLSPKMIEAKDNLVIVLRNGTYYWKIADAIPVDVIQINVTEPTISLRLDWKGDRYDVVNSGNQSISVDMYSKGGLTGSVILGSRDEEPASEIVYVGFEDE